MTPVTPAPFPRLPPSRHRRGAYSNSRSLARALWHRPSRHSKAPAIWICLSWSTYPLPSPGADMRDVGGWPPSQGKPYPSSRTPLPPPWASPPGSTPHTHRSGSRPAIWRGFLSSGEPAGISQKLPLACVGAHAGHNPCTSTPPWWLTPMGVCPSSSQGATNRIGQSPFGSRNK